jgi:hypothetical protein
VVYHQDLAQDITSATIRIDVKVVREEAGKAGEASTKHQATKAVKEEFGKSRG